MKAPEALKQILSHAKDEGIVKAFGSTLTYTELCAQLKYHLEREAHYKETDRQDKALLEAITCEEIRERIRQAGWTVPPTLNNWGGPRRGAGRPPADPAERMVRASFSLDPGLFQRLADHARVEGTSRTAVVEAALRAYLDDPPPTKQ